MNNFGNNNGAMKRRLADPRQRLQQGRFGPARNPGPNPTQQFQQRLPPGAPGRGRGRLPQPPPFAAGRGRPPGNHMPFGGPGRGFPMHQPPNAMGQHQQQHQRGPGRGFGMQRSQQPPPPPPPPQRPPFRHSPMNSNPGRMHQVPNGMGYGPNHNNVMGGRGPPAPPPPPRQFQVQHQPIPSQMHTPPPPHPHHQPLVQHAQTNARAQSFHGQQPPPQTNHVPHHPPMGTFPPPVQTPIHNRGLPPQRPTFATATPVTNPPPQQPQHAPVPQVTAPLKVPTNSYSKAQIDQAWSEHLNKGVKYYFNSILQTSTYHKPMAIEDSVQSKSLQPQVSIQSAPAAAKEVSHTWTEYTDTKTGKKYYSNGVTTTWAKPDTFVSPAAIVAQSVAAEEAASSASQENAKKKRRIKDNRETQFRNSEEAIAAFKGLLLAKGVSPTQKWNEVVKLCSSDNRWAECEAVLTTGERKQAMAEYQTKRANDLRDQERQERARAKDAFNLLLSEVLPKLPSFSVWKTRFSDIRDSISKDDRFYAVPNEEGRESLFLDFCEELRKHDERKKKNKKKEAQNAFTSFLREREEAGSLSFSSTWTSFLSSMNQADKDDGRFEVSSAMTEKDRQLYFADFVIDLQAAEDERRRKIRDARRRAEKAQREAYRDALEKLGADGKVSPTSLWRDVERLMAGDTAYEAMLEQNRDATREIFEEFIDEWDDIYRGDRQFLSQLVHPSSNREILVTRDTTYDAFVKALLSEANNSPQAFAEARRIINSEEPRSSARLYFNELLSKAKDKTHLPFRRRNFGSRRGSLQEDSSEDEGEIVEDGEGQAMSVETEAADANKEVAGTSNIPETSTTSKDAQTVVAAVKTTKEVQAYSHGSARDEMPIELQQSPSTEAREAVNPENSATSEDALHAQPPAN